MFAAWLEFPFGRVVALLAGIALVVGFVRRLIFQVTDPQDGERPAPPRGGSPLRIDPPPARDARTQWQDPATI